MWIKFLNPSTERFYDAELMEEPVSVSKNQKARVSRSVGKKLIKKYDSIVRSNYNKDRIVET